MIRGNQPNVPFVLDEILLSAGQPEKAILVDTTDVSSSHPSVLEGKCLCIGLVVVLVTPTQC